MAPPARRREAEITPPRQTKRRDGRNSAERGIRKEREEDFRTPVRPHSNGSASEGYGAPSRVRRLRPRPEFYDDEEMMRDAEMADSLANMFINCTRFDS